MVAICDHTAILELPALSEGDILAELSTLLVGDAAVDYEIAIRSRSFLR